MATPTPMQSLQQASDSAEISSITVSSRIPDFWCDQPRLWFLTFEAIIGPQKVGDEVKYNLTIQKLGKNVLEQVTDILFDPPNVKKYETLKSRLLAVYEESETRRFQKLLSEMDLGDQKPSQLLRRMRDLARNKIPDETLVVMWQGHLPPSVRAVLAVTQTEDLEQLAAIADKIVETMKPCEVSEIKPSPSESDYTYILKEIAKINLRLEKLEEQSVSIVGTRQRRLTSRSSSRGCNRRRQTLNDGNGSCYYHRRFNHRANKCIEPCTWNKATNSEN